MNYKHPKEARSETQQFMAMYTRFNEVLSDMGKVSYE